MKLWRIVLKSLRQHGLSSALAVVSIAAGVALLVATFSLRDQARKHFTDVGLGVDAVLGPKGSAFSILLCSVYHLGEIPGKVPWTYYEKVAADPLVAEAIPFSTGHSYAGYRVNAIDRRFLVDFEYMPGRRFSFSEADGGWGRPFERGKPEAVAGWEVARELGLRPGAAFNPICGIAAGDPVHVNDRLEFVGVMAPTGTPHDRAIYIPLLTFYSLEGHDPAMASDPKHRMISGAFLKLKRLPSGAMSPAVQGLQYDIRQSQTAQLVLPGEVLPELFRIIGWVDGVLVAIAAMVTALAGLFLFVALVAALKERRRDLALLRSLGATRRTVFGLVMSESVIIALAGGVAGIVAGHAIVAAGAHFIYVESGVRLSGLYVGAEELLVLPGMIVLGLVAGLLPAVEAYRLGVLTNLAPVS